MSTETETTETRAVGARSRIEGTLDRHLSADITLRQAEGAAADGLLRLRLSVSSEAPYKRSGWRSGEWIEVLGHKDGEVDLSRLNGGAAVLANHNPFGSVGDTPLASIGMVERAWIEGGRLHADIALSRRSALADLRQDIADGLVKNVSIGYVINERVLTHSGGNKGPDEYRVTKWQPLEISLVDVPADATVGLGRADIKPLVRELRVVDIPPAEGTTGDNIMLVGIPDTSAEQQTATRSIPAPTTPAENPLELERARSREITALARQFNLVTEGDKAIESGMSVDAFRAAVLRTMIDRGALRPAESPEIGMSEREMREYSFCRALLAASDPLHAARIAPFEFDASRAAQDKRGDSRKDRDSAITIPVDMLARGIQTPSGRYFQRQNVALHGGAQISAQEMYQRDLQAGTPTAGGNLIATELLSSSFIDLLRNAMVLDRLGITWLRDLNGNIAIPSQTGTASAYWVPESGSPTESQQDIDQVGMTPKTVGAYTDYSRRLLLQSSIDVEMFVRADLAAIIGLAIQQAAINGTGTNNQPLGLLNYSGIGSVAGGANGSTPTYADMVDLETAIADANADIGTMSFLTNSRMRGALRKVEEFTGCGRPVWKTGAERGIGDVLGYSAVVTNAVPRDLVKGTASNCSAIIFGNFADLMIGMWGGLDIMLDPYTGATSGTKRVIALQDVDVQLRRAVSFAAKLDALA